jgi:hypothetical protein
MSAFGAILAAPRYANLKGLEAPMRKEMQVGVVFEEPMMMELTVLTSDVASFYV